MQNNPRAKKATSRVIDPEFAKFLKIFREFGEEAFQRVTDRKPVEFEK